MWLIKKRLKILEVQTTKCHINRSLQNAFDVFSVTTRDGTLLASWSLPFVESSINVLQLSWRENRN